MKLLGTVKLNGRNLNIYQTVYADSNMAVVLNTDSGEPYGKLSVNMPELAGSLKPGEFFVKTWSENIPIVKACRTLEIFENMGKDVRINQWCVVETWKIGS